MHNHDVQQAARIVFGSDAADQVFMRRLDVPILRKAYRRRVKTCHPDRASQSGKSSAHLTLEFKRLHHSYQVLLKWLNAPHRAASWRRTSATGSRGGRQQADAPPPQPAAQPRPQHTASGRQSQHQDHAQRSQQARQQRSQHTRRQSADAAPGQPPPRAVPPRRLLFAEYCYYRGIIPYRDVIRALAWQRHQRPLFGQVAREWGFLTNHSIRIILKSQQRGERFGECARRLGYLSVFQHFAVIGKQRQLQSPIGQWLVEQQVCTPAHIDQLLADLRQHNARSHWVDA